MASYLELYDLFREDSGLKNKIRTAVVVKAQALVDLATPSTDQINWANSALSSPSGMADKLLPYVLAANKGLSVAAIQSAADTAIQTNVDAAADKLIAGGITS